MKKEIFKGAGTAIATPFDANGVNYKAYNRLLEYQLQVISMRLSFAEQQVKRQQWI